MSAIGQAQRWAAFSLPLVFGLALIYLAVTEHSGWGVVAIAIITLVAVGIALSLLAGLAFDAERVVSASGRRSRR